MIKIEGNLIVSGNIRLENDIHVTGNLECKEIISSGKIIVDGSIVVFEKIEATIIQIGKNSNIFYGILEGKLIRC